MLTCARLSAPLDQIPYTDLPWLQFDEHESTQMPFRYVKSADGQPVMPEVCVHSCFCGDTSWLDTHIFLQGMTDLIRQDADKSIDDLF